jgi:hypothetical protein
MYGDRNGQEESESEEDNEGSIKNEDEDTDTNAAASMPTPESIISQQRLDMHVQHLQEAQESNPMFLRMRPLPYHTQTPLEEHQQYNDPYLPRGVGVSFQPQSPNPHDGQARRPFDPQGYQSPQQSMYGWQSNNMVNNSMQSNYYATSPQSALANQGAYQLPPPTSQPMLPPLAPPIALHHFDLQTTRQYDTGPPVPVGNQLRTGSLGHPHHVPHGFQEYLHEGGGSFGTGEEIKENHQN